ncbi:hypothetical protein SAMN02745194_02282 [Roseomonas rosea]|uniref:Uncharacterized protein n=1 Tax=Muricoccus roseus TaxID=198092 RepID=A0A1M6I9S2_9PROT|nr:hypothetical protein [Roseomonas rosea]SHJ31249.1 hypothetical protein SAMN02745194_02282 [Roseomonas rosea]
MGAVISWVNALERSGAVMSATSEAGGLGVRSVLSPTIAEVWRSNEGGAATHRIEIDLAAHLPLRLFAFAAPRDGVRPGAGATWRVRVSNGSMGASEALNSGVLQADGPTGTAAYLGPAGVTGRYVQFSFYGVAGDPYWQIGRLWAGDTLLVESGIAMGWQRGAVDTGSSERSPLSGVRNTQRGAVARRLDFSFPRLTPAEAEALDQIALDVGTTGQAFVSPFDGNKPAMFGRFTSPPDPAQVRHQRFSARITFEEDL